MKDMSEEYIDPSAVDLRVMESGPITQKAAGRMSVIPCQLSAGWKNDPSAIRPENDLKNKIKAYIGLFYY